MNSHLLEWLIMSLFIFCVGIYGLLTRKSGVGLLISLELMINAGALNFISIHRFLYPAQVDAQVFVLFVIAIAAAEVLLALALFMLLIKKQQPVDITQLNHLKH